VSTGARVSAIVVHYRAEDCLPQCLDALLANQSEIPLEVIVVDNASLTEPKRWETAYPQVRWILRSQNQGFGTAANEGARAANGEFLLLLNSDAWPIDGALDQMVDYLTANPSVAVVNPLLFSPGGDRQPVLGGSVPTVGRMLAAKLNRILPLGPPSIPTADASGAVELQWPSGAVMLCRGRAWKEIGGFDEGFFLYFEDCDFGLRLRRNGWRIALLPRSRAIHIGGASFATDDLARHRAYRTAQERYFRKHRPIIERFLLQVLLRLDERSANS
jgi:N-acetylglucosaminyl-diphospho-decaprenol L-rhamnosyltransferase